MFTVIGRFFAYLFLVAMYCCLIPFRKSLRKRRDQKARLVLGILGQRQDWTYQEFIQSNLSRRFSSSTLIIILDWLGDLKCIETRYESKNELRRRGGINTRLHLYKITPKGIDYLIDLEVPDFKSEPAKALTLQP